MHRLMYHLVWVPKCRKRVLKSKVAKRLAELFQECTDLQRSKIEELNIQEDHVHIMVRMRPEMSVSRMVQLFKGMTSKIIRDEFPDLKEFLWENFWADGYFADTCPCAQLNESKIREYIRNQ